MKKIKIDNREVTLTSVRQQRTVYGHRRITCYFEYAGVEFGISEIINNMHDFDRAMEIDYFKERQIALYEMIADRIKDSILDEINEIEEE